MTFSDKQFEHSLALGKDIAGILGELIGSVPASEGREPDARDVMGGVEAILFGAWMLVSQSPDPDARAAYCRLLRSHADAVEQASQVGTVG